MSDLHPRENKLGKSLPVIWRKRLTLLSMLAALLGLILLTGAISQAEFSQVQSLPWNPILDQKAGMPAQAPLGSGELLFLFFRIFIFLAPLSLIYLIFSKRARKVALQQLLAGAIMIGGLLLFYNASSLFVPEESNPTGQAPAAEGISPNVNLPETAPPTTDEVNPWLPWGISLGLAVLLFWLMLRLRRIPAPVVEETPLEALTSSAQRALEQLKAGGDLQNIIMQCYEEMLHVAAVANDLPRPEYVTPSEFSLSLMNAGMPQSQVERLTRLFEGVRYGSLEVTPKQETEAISCLEAIVQASPKPQMEAANA